MVASHLMYEAWGVIGYIFILYSDVPCKVQSEIRTFQWLHLGYQKNVLLFSTVSQSKRKGGNHFRNSKNKYSVCIDQSPPLLWLTEWSNPSLTLFPCEVRDPGTFQWICSPPTMVSRPTLGPRILHLGQGEGGVVLHYKPKGGLVTWFPFNLLISYVCVKNTFTNSAYVPFGINHVKKGLALRLEP